jgi:hypothetical protein
MEVVWIETYQCQRVAQQDEARGVVGQFVCDVGHLGVDIVGGGADLERLFVDFICVGSVRFFLSWSLSLSLSLILSLSLLPLLSPLHQNNTQTIPKQHQNNKQRTNNSLRVLGARRPKAELAQRRPRLGADGIQAALGRLQAALALAPARGDVGVVGVGTCHGWLVWARGGRWVCVTRVSSTGCVCVLSL